MEETPGRASLEELGCRTPPQLHAGGVGRQQQHVVRVNERIMYVKLVIGKQIVNIVSAYAPQVGLSAEEKDDFWDSFIIVLSGIPKQASIFIGNDKNGHVGRDADGYGGDHGGVGFGTRNAV